jgi:hypothetical protein
MQSALVLVSSLLLSVGTIPYIVDIIKRTTKPRIVSWAVWGLLSAIAAFASLSDRQYPAAILSIVGTATIATIVVLGFKHGDRHFGVLDIICFVGSLCGLVAWWFSGSPSLAVLITIGVDLVGTIPTLVHMWQKPHEETWITYAFSAIGCVMIVAAADDWRVTSVAYPLYSCICCTIFVATILVRKNYAYSRGNAAIGESTSG